MTRMGTYPRPQFDPALSRELEPLWHKAVTVVEIATKGELNDGLVPLAVFAFEFLSGDEGCGPQLIQAIRAAEKAVTNVDGTALHIPNTYVPVWVAMARHTIRFEF